MSLVIICVPYRLLCLYPIETDVINFLSYNLVLMYKSRGPMRCNHIRVASAYYTDIAANKEDEYPSAMKLLSVWRDTEYVAVSSVDKCSNPIIHSRDTSNCFNTNEHKYFCYVIL
jgi:hypothetical protein